MYLGTNIKTEWQLRDGTKGVPIWKKGSTASLLKIEQRKYMNLKCPSQDETCSRNRTRVIRIIRDSECQSKILNHFSSFSVSSRMHQLVIESTRYSRTISFNFVIFLSSLCSTRLRSVAIVAKPFPIWLNNGTGNWPNTWHLPFHTTNTTEEVG